jgi:hypothetical protein
MRVLFFLLALQIPLGLDRGLLAPPENPVTEEKAALGRLLFFDKRLSLDNSLACSDCHRPRRAFSDDKRVAVGVKNQHGNRNTPAIVNRAYGRFFFWDGRISTLEEQVLQPIQNPKEMAADLPVVVERLRADSTYRELFQKVLLTFGRSSPALHPTIVMKPGKRRLSTRWSKRGCVCFAEKPAAPSAIQAVTLRMKTFTTRVSPGMGNGFWTPVD